MAFLSGNWCPRWAVPNRLLLRTARRRPKRTGVEPDRVLVAASGNIIKNVKSVIVPNTNGRKGIAVAAAIGIVAGDESRGLEVIASSGTDTEERLAAFLASTEIKTEAAESDYPLDIMVTLWRGDSSACVRIVREHTNIVMIRRNENVLFEKKTVEPCTKDGTSDNSFMSMEEIYDFADTADLSDVRELIGRQIRYNSAIAEEGLRGDYGANIGRILLRGDSSVRTRAKALAAAGSDARMNGCSLPVVINSGSGNQGLTASLPVIAYAQEWGSSEEKLYRALLLSNLITLHEKAGIGRLSAYCGAVSAGGRLRGYCLSSWRGLPSGYSHGCKCACSLFRHCLRRSKVLLCGENCSRG